VSADDHRRSKVNLWKAVHALQGEATTLQKDKINPHFKSKYLALDTLMEEVLPLLNANGLIWLTAPNYQVISAGGTAVVEPNLSYRLIHAESGEETAGTVPLFVAKRDPQGLGSAITYARRYALMAVLGLVADEDDDGASAGAAKAPSAAGRGTKRITKTRAEGLAKAAERAGCLDRLQLAASHTHGDDVGDCSTVQTAVAALTALTMDEANRVREWIDRKAAEALER
jgi:hypothetical protein